MIDEGAEYAVDFRAWLDIIYRSSLDKVKRRFAEAVALCGDSDGTNIFPGTALLTFRTGYSYDTVQAGVAYLHKVGLLHLVKAGSGRHRGDGSSRMANEYRLIQHPFKLDAAGIAIMSPTEAKAAIEAIRKEHEGKPRKKMHPAGEGAFTATGTEMHPVEAGAFIEPVEEMHPVPRGAEHRGSGAEELMHPVQAGAFFAPEPGNAPGLKGSKSRNAPGLILQNQEMHPVPRGTTEVLRATDKTDRPNPTQLDLRTGLTVLRANDSEDPKIEVLPEKCVHRIKARLRPDGTSSCFACRMGIAIPSPREATA